MGYLWEGLKMTKVFEYAEHMMLLDMPIKKKKIYHLNKMIEGLKAYMNYLKKDGFSPDGSFMQGLETQLRSFINLRGELLRC